MCAVDVGGDVYTVVVQGMLIGEGEPGLDASFAKQRPRGDTLNPGVKFGYWGSREYFLKNIGYVKNYRTARQLLLDAEAAMAKTLNAERWKFRHLLQKQVDLKMALIEKVSQQDGLISRLLQEKEVRQIQ